MSAPGHSGHVLQQAGQRPAAAVGARAKAWSKQVFLGDGFLGAALGGLILAGWAVGRYTTRRVPRALRE